MILSKNQWILKEYDKFSADVLASAFGLKYPVCALLAARGHKTPEQARHYLEKDTAVLYDPFLMKDMDKAVRRIFTAVENGEKITIYGDYDVDGITSVCLLHKYLAKQGCNIGYYIPSRENEGYGLNTDAVGKLIDKGTTLIITVDTGITAINEVEYAKSHGADVIVTDHHECSQSIPNACAVVNPKRKDNEYPFKDLAGVGVVFKLICACEQYRATGKTYTDQSDTDANIKAVSGVCIDYSDLTAIGTVADVMPLVDENRLIVSFGLNRLSHGENIGISALVKASGNADSYKKMTSSVISFTLAPRINAAGRMGTAEIAVQLLLTDDSEQADDIAQQLCRANAERQGEEMKIMACAEEMISSENLAKTKKILVLSHDNWHHGVIGIVASKLTEKYNIPCILISFEGAEGAGKGSGRSIEGFNLHGALLYCEDLLERFGGHALAAGLTVSRERFDEFKHRIEQYAQDNISDGDTVKKIAVDMQLEPKDISLAVAEELLLLEPYGTSNPTPLFMLSDADVVSIGCTATNKHSRIVLEKNNEKFQCVMFGRTPETIGITEGDRIDVLFNLGINVYRGSKSRQMIIRDIDFCKQTSEYILKCAQRARQVIKGEEKAQMCHIPNRGECAAVFKMLKDISNGSSGVTFVTPILEKGIGYEKLLIITEVFAQLGFISYTWNTPWELAFDIIPQSSKKPLEDSPLYKRLNQNLFS